MINNISGPTGATPAGNQWIWILLLLMLLMGDGGICGGGGIGDIGGLGGLGSLFGSQSGLLPIMLLMLALSGGLGI